MSQVWKLSSIATLVQVKTTTSHNSTSLFLFPATPDLVYFSVVFLHFIISKFLKLRLKVSGDRSEVPGSLRGARPVAFEVGRRKAPKEIGRHSHARVFSGQSLLCVLLRAYESGG